MTTKLSNVSMMRCERILLVYATRTSTNMRGIAQSMRQGNGREKVKVRSSLEEEVLTGIRR